MLTDRTHDKNVEIFWPPLYTKWEEKVHITGLRLWGDSYLQQIQVILSNGFVSPIFAAKAQGKMVELDLDLDKNGPVKHIFSKAGGGLRALSFLGYNGLKIDSWMGFDYG